MSMTIAPSTTPRPRDTPQPRQLRPTPGARCSSSRTPQPPIREHDALAPSPNYFGLPAKPDNFMSSAAQHARTNWSPPTSGVRSAAAASPLVIPLDQNPEFDAFRRQSENTRFSLGALSDLSSPRAARPRSSIGSAGELSQPSASSRPAPPPSKGKTTNLEPPSHSRSPKRGLSSLDPPFFPDRPRRHSPASFSESGVAADSETATFLPLGEYERPSLPAPRANAPSPPKGRAETLPATLENETRGGMPTLVAPQHVATLLEACSEEILLLDTRVSTQYSRSKIIGALNLCIPTTLLKRASFNVQKLAETFSDQDHKSKFDHWRSCKYIVVYDCRSALLKDATTCVNMVKKFVNEGWTGPSYIVAGGFEGFSQKFPALVTRPSNSNAAPTSSHFSLLSVDGPAVAPVAGGCPMPSAHNAANPFFGNIRQNMDLIGGVGQIAIKRPASLTGQLEENLPAWLRKATSERDEGKALSEKFLQIEKREQKRMQDAFSGKVSYGTPNGKPTTKFQLAGIEKGAKNRYSNIIPFEHSRVKIQGVSEGGCDYINANHIQAAWSNKRYIATQGPVPATFVDFWNVVWQQNARVIVMLTAEKEGGQIKAHNYWDRRRYGQLQLNFLSEHRASLEPSKIHRHRERPSLGQRRSTSESVSKPLPPDSPSAPQPYVTVRKFTLSHDGHPFERMREITQLQYSSWPDFGAPAHPAHLLGLIEQCDSVVRSISGGGHYSKPDSANGHPVLVHCSAGCGRTGTFCTVDSVIDMLKRQRCHRSQQRRSSRQRTPMDMDGAPNPFDSCGFESDWLQREDVDLIEKVVEEFRLQRLSMVQSLRQFVLCYESVLEWLVNQGPKTA